MLQYKWNGHLPLYYNSDIDVTADYEIELVDVLKYCLSISNSVQRHLLHKIVTCYGYAYWYEWKYN